MAVMNPIPFNSWADLFSGDQGTLDHAWKLFMDDLVPLVAIAPEGLQDNIIQGGGNWSGAGYGQGNLSRLIFDMSKVGVLSTRFDVYRDVILVALALHWRLNSLPKVLDGDAKQAAFALCDALGADAPGPTLPWAVEELELSESFQSIWDNMKVQLEFEDRKRLLKDIPFFKGLPHDAACNNHRRDGNVAVDKVHKSWENATLNILRMLAVIDAKLVDPQATPSDIVLDSIVGRTFAATTDLFVRIQEYRKQKSIPDAMSFKNPLFSKEDLALAAHNQKVNKASSYSSAFRNMPQNNQGQGRYNNNARQNYRSGGKGRGKGGKGYRQSGYSSRGAGSSQANTPSSSSS